jgi:hypothetical protein
MMSHDDKQAPTGTIVPRLARVSSRSSGDGQALHTGNTASISRRQRAYLLPQHKRTAAGQLLRHNLVTPEKKTLKRIDALRRQLATGVDDHGVAVNVDSIGARIYELLRLDRGLSGSVADEAFVGLASKLTDQDRLGHTAASVVGSFLRSIGGIERSKATPERVKSALAMLSDALYDLDDPDAPIPAHVRDLRMERRDGGLQIVAILRHRGDEELAILALKAELRRGGYGDIDVRAERLAPTASRRPSSASPRP